MLLFSTILSIRDTLTKDNFIELIIKWNQNSPHEENIIKNLIWNGERNITFEDGNCSLAIEEYRNENIIAIRYEKKGDGVLWDSDYTQMIPKIQKGLEELGFEITHNGHYKAVYHGDERYILTYGSSPSDVRAGKNNASLTINEVF